MRVLAALITLGGGVLLASGEGTCASGKDGETRWKNADLDSLDSEEVLWALVDWVREHDGYVNPKLALHAPADGPRGLRTNAVVEENEPLMLIPLKAQITIANAERWGLATSVLSQVKGMEDMTLQHPAFSSFLTREMELRHKSMWGLYLLVLQNEGYDHMPFWQAPEVQALMEGSPEHYNAIRGHYWYTHDHTKIVHNVHRWDLGKFNYSQFVNANLGIACRSFSSSHGHALAPVADLLNHSPDPTASWYYDSSADVLRVSAVRRLDAMDEVTISYGVRSNAQLMSTYGFTIHPKTEPVYTYRIWTSTLSSMYGSSISEADVTVDIKLNTNDVSTAAMNDLVILAKTQGVDVQTFVHAHVARVMEAYHNDSLVMPHIARLKANRKLVPSTSVWWTKLYPKDHADAPRGEEADGEVASEEDATSTPSSARLGRVTVGHTWHANHDESHITALRAVQEAAEPGTGKSVHIFATTAVRMKMSEYLCLTAYLESLEILAGELSVQQALAISSALTPKWIQRLPK